MADNSTIHGELYQHSINLMDSSVNENDDVNEEITALTHPKTNIWLMCLCVLILGIMLISAFSALDEQNVILQNHFVINEKNNVTTTQMPTTQMPTTQMVTTKMPTTQMPTTKMPTTQMPTTQMPTTKMPTTKMPTTQMPTTQMPTTQMPTTKMPTTKMLTNISITNIVLTNDSTAPTNITFPLTCMSFEDICHNLSKMLNVPFVNITINEFDTKCVYIDQFIAQNASSLSPLFILSFRREFILNKYYKSVDNNCLKLLFMRFKVLHSKIPSFHHAKKPILYHTHISKAAGSANYLLIHKIMQELTKYKYINYTYKVLNNAVKGYVRGFVFCGSRDCGSFPSCEKYYNDFLEEERTRHEGRIIRMADETPLSTRKICPQFYNSIIVREPISHRLSFLAFMNKFNPESKALYFVKENKTQMCRNNNDMKGIINELFQKNNTGYIMNNLRLKLRKVKGNHVYEWVNPNIKNFMIGLENKHRNNKNRFNIPKDSKKCVYREFNTTYLMGWLSNTYARWIGYHHPNEDTVLDSLFSDYIDINKNLDYLLRNTQRVLIQYDYVLPLDTDQYTIQHPIYQYYAKDIQIKIFGTKDYDSYISNLTVDYSNKKQFGISTSGLFTAFNESAELDLLIHLNQIDLKIFEFSKKIAAADTLFNKWIYNKLQIINQQIWIPAIE